MTFMKSLTVVVILLSAASAGAKPKTQPPGKSVVRFDGDTIDGDLMRPDGDLMAGRQEPSMPDLVVPPKSFAHARRQTILSAADAVAGRRAQDINTTAR